jgi:hypothetical protein
MRSSQGRLPYDWHPSGTRLVFKLKPGMLLPIEHRVLRVIEVRDRSEDFPDDGRPIRVILRPADLGDDCRDRDSDESWSGGKHTGWNVYRDEHYPVCAKCSEPLPCREQMAERISGDAAKRMSRYETAGVCPSCGEVVSSRQESLTWSDNIEVIGGPPVTFHMRRACRHSAGTYEKRWVAADPERRKATLTCPGHITNHNDGTYECSEFGHCPGWRASHRGYTVCRCPDCHARGPFGCTPRKGAKMRGPLT